MLVAASTDTGGWHDRLYNIRVIRSLPAVAGDPWSNPKNSSFDIRISPLTVTQPTNVPMLNSIVSRSTQPSHKATARQASRSF